MYTKYPNTLIHRLAQSLIGKLIKVIASLVSHGTECLCSPRAIAMFFGFSYCQPSLYHREQCPSTELCLTQSFVSVHVHASLPDTTLFTNCNTKYFQPNTPEYQHHVVSDS